MRPSRLWIAAIGCALLEPIGQAQELSLLHQFSASVPSEKVSNIVVDSTGVYLAGGTDPSNVVYPPISLDSFVRKTDKKGNELWVRRFGGATLVSGIVANDGGIYVAGETGWNVNLQAYFTLPAQPALGFGDAFVRRYDPDGNEVWTRQFGTENYDYVYGIAVESTGVYVVGRLGVIYNTFPSGQTFLRKYDTSGNEQWTRQLDASYDFRSIVAAAGSIYVGGRFTPPGADSAVLRKYDASGSEMWTRELSVPSATYAYAYAQVLAASAAGVYLSKSLPSSMFIDFYDQDGNKVREILRHESSPVLVVDDTGFYSGGGDYNLPGECPAGNDDADVRRYDLDGNEVWARQFGTWQSDVATALASDSTGVYAVGNIGSSVFLARLEKQSLPQNDTKPRIKNQCVVNSASFEGGALAPGELVTVLGSSLGAAQVTAHNLSPGDVLPTILAGTRVLFNGIPGPLLYVSDQQVNAVVPTAGIDVGSNVDVQVEYQGVLSNAVTLPVFGSRLGVFFRGDFSSKQTVLLNNDGTLNSPSNPAAPGSVVTLYATGTGPTGTTAADGQIVGDPPPQLRTPARLYFSLYGASCDPIAEFDSDALFSGDVPGFVNGLVQIKAQLPSSMLAGDWDVAVKIGGPFRSDDPYRGPSTSAGLTVSVR